MSRITQRPRQIDINKPMIKYDNFEEFSKLDTTYETQDQQITTEKVANLTITNENVVCLSANKKKEQIMKDKKEKGDSISLALHKQDILIPEAKKIEEENKNN